MQDLFSTSTLRIERICSSIAFSTQGDEVKKGFIINNSLIVEFNQTNTTILCL